MMEAKIERKALYEKWWVKYPYFKDVLLKTGLLLKYRTWNVQKLPNKISLPSSRTIYINPTENRGRALLLRDGVTQERLTSFWQKSVAVFKPTIVLDIGVNYGECIFSTTYNKKTTIIGVEANEQLLSYIDQSRLDHPNRDQIQIVYGFATNSEKETHSFFVDKNWSGTSSGTKMVEHDLVEEFQVPSVTINTLLKNQVRKHDRLLFKIDVEGFESFVLEGMYDILKETKEAIGFIEFDSEYMKRAGTSLSQFFEKLKEEFHIYAYVADNQIKDITALSYKELEQWWQSDEIHTDLILSTMPLPRELKV
ncbi:FkbM family methyltransferase [Bacillus sp. DJP31]|uniref:FkbM family methyltransferase n=1 Tax=Bacillus sp. DJP31 TaxID=3409789 RepID=UPI003BB4B656